MASSLTHRDLSRQLGISETTVKSYRRKFPGCIPVANEGKPIRFEPAAAAVCERIRDLFATGMAVAEIRRRLAREFDWIVEDEAAPAPSRTPEPSPAAPPRSLSAIPREGQEKVLASLSTLAKSVVSLSLEHSSILKRLEKIADQPAQALFAPFESAFAALCERLDRQEMLLARLETLVSHLGRHGSPLAGRSPVFQGQEAAAETPRPADAREEAPPLVEEEPLFSPEAADGRRDLFFEGSSKGEKTKTDKKFQRWAEQPFLAKNSAGQYVNIGRPRFSINALRAVLADRIAFPERYALACYESGDDTWLTLALSGPRRSLSWRLLLVPARTTKKNDVILAERAFLDEEEVPTALFHEFVDELIG